MSLFLRALFVGTAALLAAACGPTDRRNDSSEWSLRGGNAEGQHYSPLADIDEASVGRLGLAWYADLPMADGPVGTPVVAKDMLFLIGTLNIVHAYDVRTGALRWSFDPEVRFDGHILPSWGARVVRGLAYAEGRILFNTGDCRLVAIEAENGAKAWDSRVCPADDEYTITSAPRIGGGKVFVGPNNADFGTRRGYVDAFDVRTGRHLWRFHTIPSAEDQSRDPAMAMAAKSWDPDFLPQAVGGSVWEEMIYDAETNLVYLGVGGPAPWNPEDRGAKRGDELFTNSIVALDADTGRYVWHYQTTPGDAWNLEPTMPMILADLEVGGRKRRVVMQAPKNGFFYVLDARTGKLVNEPRNFVRVNWTGGLHPKTGRPTPNPVAQYWKSASGAVVYPGPLGAHNFNPMSYHPGTGLVYIPALDLPTQMTIDRSAAAVGGAVHTDYLSHADEAKWPLVAWDPVEQKVEWSTDGSFGSGSGVLSTGGDLVFQGTADGLLRAYRAGDGASLWSFDTGGAVVAAPITVTVDGVQHLFVLSGPGTTSAANRGLPTLYGREGVRGAPRLLAFRLGAKVELPRLTNDVVRFPEPPRPRPDRRLAERGRILFETRACVLCHGTHANVVPGSVPDLRRSSAAVHDRFDAIVRTGLLQSSGMPNFGDIVSAEDSAALQAFVIHEAWEAYARQSDSGAVNSN